MKISPSKPLEMVVNANGQFRLPSEFVEFHLSCDDAPDRDEWRLRIKEPTD